MGFTSYALATLVIASVTAVFVPPALISLAATSAADRHARALALPTTDKRDNPTKSTYKLTCGNGGLEHIRRLAGHRCLGREGLACPSHTATSVDAMSSRPPDFSWPAAVLLTGNDGVGDDSNVAVNVHAQVHLHDVALLDLLLLRQRSQHARRLR